MTRPFDPRELRGLRRDRLTAAEAEPELFIGGDPAQGFYSTPVPPDLGYWGITFHAKRINADLENPGNLLTWVANRVSSLTGSERRFVSVGAGSFLGAVAFGDSTARTESEAQGSISGWKYLSNRFSPLQDVSAIDKRIAFEDEDFDPEEAVREFVAASPGLVRLMEEHGRPLDMLMTANNRDAFTYILNRELLHIQAQQNMAEFNSEVGAFKNVSSKIISAGWNWMATDPSFVPSFMIGVGGANLANNAARAGVGIVRIGNAAGRATRTGRLLRAAGVGVTRAGGAPAAAHAALAGRWSTAAANGVELAMYGAAFDAALQQERITDYNTIFEGTPWQREFSYAELGLATVIVGSMGYALGKLTSRFTGGHSIEESRRGALASVDVDPESVIARRGMDPESVNAQGVEDMLAIRFQELAEKVTGGDHANLGFALDRTLLDEVGLALDDVTEFLEIIALGLDGEPVDSQAVVRMVQDLFTQARAAREASGVGRDVLEEALQRQARNNALVRALREIPQGQRTPQTIARAVDALAPDEMLALRAKTPAQAPVGINPAATDEQLQNVVNRIGATLERRPLLEIEEEQLLWASLQLGESGTGRALLPRFDIANFAPTDDFGRAMMSLAEARTDIADITARIAAGETGLDKALRSARIRARRRATKMRGAAPPPAATPSGPTRAQVQAEAAAAPSATRKQRKALFDRWFEAPDPGDASLMEDVTVVGRAMRAAGLGRFFSRLATEKTGEFQTVRSIIAGVRKLAQMFDHTRFTVESLGATGAEYVPNLTDAQWRLIRLFAPMEDFVAKLQDKGFFKRRTGRTLEGFQEEAWLHAHGVAEAPTPEARELADLWVKLRTRVNDVGLANGTITEAEAAIRVPRRVELGKAMKNKLKLREALTRFFTKKALASDDVHMDTLVSMGMAERIDTGKVVKWRLTGPLRPLSREPIEGLQVSQLDDLAPLYREALTGAVDERGLTGIGGSMRRVVTNLTHRRNYSEDAGRLTFDQGSIKLSEFEKALDDGMFLDDEIRSFFRTDLLSLAHDYARHDGFDIWANSLAQRMTGIRNLTFAEFLDFSERQLKRFAKEGTDETDRIEVGVKELREKFARMSGRERRLISEAEGVGEFLTENVEAGTLAFFGGTIGNAIVTTETLVSMLIRILNPADFGRRLVNTVAGLNPITHNATYRRHLAYLSLSTRLTNNFNVERFIGGSVQSDFQFRTIDRILAPWRTFLDTVIGRTGPGPRSVAKGRARALPQGIEALGRTSFTIGGGQFFNRLAWINNIVALKGETAAFWKAARKMAATLEQRGDELRDINRAARQVALDAGRSEEAAVRAGNLAEFKVWRGIAREAGFGSQWQVAKDFSRHGLMDTRVLDLLTEAGEASGGLKTRGPLPVFDLERIGNHVNDIDSARAPELEEAVNRVADMFERKVRNRVAEQSILSTPTSEASRTYWGRMFNAMTSFSRAFFNNVVLDMAQMPSRNAAGLAAAFVLGEALNRMSRRLYNGESVETLEREWTERPIATMTNYAFNLPVLGQMNFLLRAGTEAMLTDRQFNQDFTQGAAVSVANDAMNLASTAFQAPFNEAARERLGHQGERFARRLTPGLNSHWGGLFTVGMDAAFDTQLRPQPRRGRTQRDPRPSLVQSQLPGGELGDILPPRDDIPEDLSFLIPKD